jgi:predicted transcriptional regulator
MKNKKDYYDILGVEKNATLDEIKKDLRNNLKKLTRQEMAVFSAVYELENKGFIVDYTLLSNALNLTESSIRDYIQRLVKKGIPIEKFKENNKKVLVNISRDLKQIASLQTILQLRKNYTDTINQEKNLSATELIGLVKKIKTNLGEDKFKQLIDDNE